MKLIKLSLAAAIAATVMMAEEAKSDLGVSANLALASNYVWRGMTQTEEAPAIQGGFDLDYKGVYAGVWASNVAFAGSIETDLYLGYTGEVSGVSYDVGFVQYAYSKDVEASNFGEAYLGLGYDFGAADISAKYSLGVETNDLVPTDYIEVAAGAPLPGHFAVSVHFGTYADIGTDYSVGISKEIGKVEFDVSYVAFTADSATGAEDQDSIDFIMSTSF